MCTLIFHFLWPLSDILQILPNPLIKNSSSPGYVQIKV